MANDEAETENVIAGTRKGRAPVPLSVLDLAPIGVDSTPTEALRTSTKLAQLCERLGYHRYWVAEHHGMPGIASSSPAVLIAHLAAHTSTLRIGSGGVMLPNHAPLVAAEQFGMLEALHPGRIDLGVGRAPGTDQATARALRRSSGPAGADDFPEQLAELEAFLGADFPAGHPYADVQAVPAAGMPAVWLLGSSGFSAQLAALLGRPFSFAHHFSAQNTMPALALYRERFQPSAVLDRPYASIGVHAIAADTEELAYRLSRTVGLNMLRLRRGSPGRVPSLREADEYPYTEAEEEFLANWLSTAVYGTPESVRTQLDELAERTGADELMITANIYAEDVRLRSFELIAKAYEMS
ncbi:luciferase family oxidoreductase group 1 [Tamaricihabitans halophyticus]|uniref:Luciferase family oxidoreductase group 1 n=1 Tax=Tamaricihabitans halophyticus TaxID=1262583 RepID=A0A4R2QSV6_9PSEU|nr:LLM class flavin-dependent oxidoreductase [Tamaricihabitans halophyticus]TCP50151.1 luciferase family oxidoreductase group 1 [Tamaricihabitans halophyticus]